MFKQVVGGVMGRQSFNAPKLIAPVRSFFTVPRAIVATPTNFGLIKPAMMTFSATSVQAAETPASHMHRTMSLDRSISSFFEKQTG